MSESSGACCSVRAGPPVRRRADTVGVQMRRLRSRCERVGYQEVNAFACARAMRFHAGQAAQSESKVLASSSHREKEGFF